MNLTNDTVGIFQNVEKKETERECKIVNYILNLNDEDIHDNPNQFCIHLIIISLEIHLWLKFEEINRWYIELSVGFGVWFWFR